MNESKKRKFNIVDIVVLLILLAAVVFFAIKVLKPDAASGTTDATVSEKRTGTAYFTVEVDGLRKDMYDALASQLPQQMLANGKLTEGGIIHSATSEECKIAYLEVANPINTTLSTYIIPNEDAEYVNAFFVCQAPIDLVNYNHWSISQDIRVGRQYYLKTPMIELTGTVIDLTVEGEVEE